MNEKKQEANLEIVNDPPPLLGSWTRLYTIVLIAHVVIIALFYLFTYYYS